MLSVGAWTDAVRPESSPGRALSQADLDALVAPDARIGIAVSGGPDSLALLLLAAAARPGQVEAATVDHRLRAESAAEAEMVARSVRTARCSACTLTAEWAEKPSSAIQERARDERYRLLGDWAERTRLAGARDRSPCRRPGRNLADAPRPRRGRAAALRRCARRAAPWQRFAPVRPLLGWRRRARKRLRRQRVSPRTTRATATSGTNGCASAATSARSVARSRGGRAQRRASWPTPTRRSTGQLEQEWDRCVTEGEGEHHLPPVRRSRRNRPPDRRAARSRACDRGRRPASARPRARLGSSKRCAAGRDGDACEACNARGGAGMALRSGPPTGLDLWITAD